ncbi:MAG: hypothetical protein ACQESP_13015 [Candidatus Muiribacteriota bacterium]
MEKNKIDGLIKYFRLLGYDNQVKVFELQTDIVRKNREQKKTPEFFFHCWLEAVNQFKKIELAQHQKKSLSDKQIEVLGQLRKNRIKNKHGKKGSPAKEKIKIAYYELIKKLRAEEMSWRDISAYIAKYHKTKISHVYIRKAFLELQQEEEN